MSDTYLNHYRHLTFSIHRHTHKAEQWRLLPMDKKQARRRKGGGKTPYSARASVLGQAAGAEISA